MPDLEAIKDGIRAVLKEKAKGLWDGEEDTDFLEEVVGDLAKLRLMKLTVSDEDKESLKDETEMAAETLEQKVQQKKNKLNKMGKSLLPEILSTILKTLVSVP